MEVWLMVLVINLNINNVDILYLERLAYIQGYSNCIIHASDLEDRLKDGIDGVIVCVKERDI